MPFALVAQESTDTDTDSDVEEVVVVGSQIKGASITAALPVTVLSAEDIEALGVSDGEELVEGLVEQGMNFFNEQERASGVVLTLVGVIQVLITLEIWVLEIHLLCLMEEEW